MKIKEFILLGILLVSASFCWCQEKGKRALELDWAGRTESECKPFLDFEKWEKWRLEKTSAEATFSQSSDRPIWGKFTAKLTYRANEESSDRKKVVPVVRIYSPEPIPLPKEKFDTITCWINGDSWGLGANTDLTTPIPTLHLLFQIKGKSFEIPLTTILWRNWFLVHKRLTPEWIEKLNSKDAYFQGFQLTGGTQTTDRTIYLDDLSFYTEQFAPIKFNPRPKRGIDMFPGQNCGLNTGEGSLPFPVAKTTIIPNTAAPNSKNTIESDNETFVFRYEGPDGKLNVRFRAVTGSWSDFSVRWNEGPEIRPLYNGGVTLLNGKSNMPEPVTQKEVKSVNLVNGVLVIRATLYSKTTQADVRYDIRLFGKTLVLDTFSNGGKVHQVSFGSVRNLKQPRILTIPYFTGGGGYGKRPAILIFENKIGEQLFLGGEIDWYRSHASEYQGRNSLDATEAIFHGGTRYLSKTDGTFNNVFERFIITLSPKMEEIFPVISNPPSPYKAVTGKKLWRVHAAYNREQDKAIWKYVHRYGITEVVINDHETQWRNGGEGFTFRTRTDPLKGGDPAQIEYSKYLRETLGYVYGPYNNFTDFAPVNEFWSFDLISRRPDKSLQPSWMRCYGPKPSLSVEYCEKISPILKQKFEFNTAYCDVHTSVTPWSRTDYDARVPGAGTFAATFYAYGEIMLLQKKAWKGPVYSEGPNHYYYSGLTDGNYAQDQGYKFNDNPWLVDFDLRRMHDLECNFGMGNLGMFSPAVTREERLFYTPHLDENSLAGRDHLIDRFLAATIAFGHPGFLILDYCFDPPKAFGLAYGVKGTLHLEQGIRIAMRSYYMLQQIAARYTQTSADVITYVDSAGKQLSVSEAVASNVYRRSQVLVRYKDGTITASNGSKTEWMKTEIDGHKIELAPGGYTAWTKDRLVWVESNMSTGKRFDYSVSPEYIYLDTREGTLTMPKAAGTGVAVCRLLKGGSVEIIPLPGSRIGFSLDIKRIKALDFNGKELGDAKIRKENGYTYIEPIKNAVSYRSY